METIIAAAGIIISALTYFAGVKRGKRESQEQREHEIRLEVERQEHDGLMEASRRRHERIVRVADQYVTWARKHHDNGPHALVHLGLEQLGSDADIREAIEDMRVRNGHGNDPWAGAGGEVEDVDLVVFFRHVRENGIDFFRTTVADVAEEVRLLDGGRREKT